MLYLYVGGILIAVINITLGFRKNPKHGLIANFLILLVGLAFMPLYYATFTEIETTQYAEINQISQEIKANEGAAELKAMIEKSLDDKKITVKEYSHIQEAYSALMNDQIGKAIIKNGVQND